MAQGLTTRWGMRTPFVVAAGTALLVACSQHSPRSDSASPSKTGASAANTCADSIEARALACSRGTARRSHDTLFLRLDSGRDTAIVSTVGEEEVTYQYAGRIGDKGPHLIEQLGGHSPPRFLVMSPRSGAWISAPGMPALSVDGARFAAANDTWDCAESPDQRLEVWRLTDSIPISEWKLAELHCEANGAEIGSAAVHPVWRGADTLEFTRIERVKSNGAIVRQQRRTFAVPGPHGWTVLEPRR